MKEFKEFPEIAHFNREVIVKEKIDGTHASIHIGEDCEFLTGSRTRWITPGDDNFGFARWADERKDEPMLLGPGTHFGEWWDSGVQRKYGLANGECRFSLFNTVRWCLNGQTPQPIPCGDSRKTKMQDVLPACVGLVPILWRGPFAEFDTASLLDNLRTYGSIAQPGFMNPEGIVIFHIAGLVGFKMTLDNDDAPKSTLKG